MASLTFELDTRKVEKKLDILAKSVKDFKDPFEDAGDDLVEHFSEDVIYAQGQKSGGRWRDWSPTTIKLRTSRSGYYKAPPERTDLILVWTGRLRKGFRRTANAVSLRIYNVAKYFGAHQTGEGKIPRRPILDINAEVIGIVMKRVQGFIEKILKQ